MYVGTPVVIHGSIWKAYTYARLSYSKGKYKSGYQMFLSVIVGECLGMKLHERI